MIDLARVREHLRNVEAGLAGMHDGELELARAYLADAGAMVRELEAARKARRAIDRRRWKLDEVLVEWDRTVGR